MHNPHLGHEWSVLWPQSSQKTFLATSPVGLVTAQAYFSKTKSISPVRLVAGNIH